MNRFRAITKRAVRALHLLDRSGGPVARNAARASGQPLGAAADIDEAFPTTTSTRLSATVRLIACFAAFHSILQVYLIQQRLTLAPLVLVFLFAAYVGALYWRAVRNSAFRETRIVYWFDMLWYLGFTALTGGPGSHFSFFLPFPVLFVSLGWGFTPGITVAICSASALLIMGAISSGSGSGMLSADVLLPPIALLVLGFLIATWANSGLALNRRLASLKKINTLFNPRLNIEQVVDRAVRHLTEFYGIDKFALVLVEANRPVQVFRANLPDEMYRVSDVAAVEIADVLLGLDAKGPVVYCGGEGLRQAELHSLPASRRAASHIQLAGAAAIANRLDCAQFGSVEFTLRQGGTARLFVCSSNDCFGPADVSFFGQFGEQLAPRIENVQLLDRLAREIADREREKISRDIHDSAIQPYIGLKFALEAIARKASPADPLAKDLEKLTEMVHREIGELRRYVKGLRGLGEPGNAALVPAVRRQAARFGELYGITVDVQTTGELRVDDALADEAFHMVSEGLSNVRRHTNASLARIGLSCDAQRFTLRIANPRDSAISPKLFTPRSISERSLALGGTCTVEVRPDHDTVVIVEIPLST